MNNVELGLSGEGYIAKKLDTMGVKYWWNPSQRNRYGADFLTEYGIIDVKTAKPQITNKKGIAKKFWNFNCHHHGEKQEAIDIFIFILADYKDSKFLYFIMPKELCKKHVFKISERQIENGKYSYFLDAWDIITKTKSRNLALEKCAKKKATWNPTPDLINFNSSFHRALKNAKIYQRELSEITGISAETLSYIMVGKRNPSDNEKKKIEDILGSIEWVKNKK